MEPSYNNFGARLRALIERKGVSQLEFSKEFGLSESQLYNWLKRDDPPLAKHWTKLSNYFGVSSSFLTAGIPDKVEHGPRAMHESPNASYGLAAGANEMELVRLLETRFSEILKFAEGNVARLGWIYEQMDQHIYRAAMAWDVPNDSLRETFNKKVKARIEAEAKATGKLQRVPSISSDKPART